MPSRGTPLPLFLFLTALTGCSDVVTEANFNLSSTPPYLVLQRLDTATIAFTVIDLQGNPVAGHAVQLRPQDPTLLTVSAVGLVRSLGPVGTTGVIATDPSDHLVDTVQVIIRTTPTVVRLSPPDTAIAPGGTVYFTAVILDSAGVVPNGSFTLSFQPSNGSLVNEGDGVVHSWGPTGEFLVTATASGAFLVPGTAGAATGYAGLTVLDTAATGRLPAAGHPDAVVLDAAGHAFVSRAGATFLTHYNTAARMDEGSLYVPLGTAGVAVDTGGSRVYAMNTLAVFGIDVATGTLVDTLRSGGQPIAVGTCGDDQSVWVSAVGDELLGFDQGTGHLTQTLSLTTLTQFGQSPPGDTLLYGAVGGSVVEINCHRGSVGRTFPVGGSVNGVAISGDGQTLFAADATGNRVAVWDLVLGAVEDSVALPGSPHGIAVARDGGQLWVSIPSLGEVLVFDPASLAPLKTVITHGSPRGVGVGPAGSVALVANDSGWVDIVPR